MVQSSDHRLSACALCCVDDTEEIIVSTPDWRVVLVDDAAFPGFCRVIRQAHAQEMTDISPPERTALMDVVWAVEAAIRSVMQPDKINLASLGNMVPHVHWHVIPRFRDDSHFPNPIWGQAERVATVAALAQRRALLPALRMAIVAGIGHRYDVLN